MSSTQYLETKIIKNLLSELLDAGFFLTVNDGEEDVITASNSAEAILGVMFSTDEDWLKVAPGSPVKSGWIRLIYGNGCDVISDLTTNLEPYISETEKLVDEMSA